MDPNTEYRNFIMQQLVQLRGEMERAIRLIESKNRQGLQIMAQLHNIFMQMLDTDPDNPHILFSVAAAQMYLGGNGVTIAILEKCLQQDPTIKEAWNNLGGCWRSEFFLDRAEVCYQKALEITESEDTPPERKSADIADIYSNMGSLWVNEGEPRRAETQLQKALDAQPNNPHAKWNMALAKLELKKYKEGFALYDAGFSNGTRIMRHYGNADYFTNVSEGKDKTIVIWGEQGLGDEILFAQYIPAFIEAVQPRRVIFDCHPRLESIWKRYFTKRYTVPCYPTRKTKPDWVPREEPIDYKMAIASLPQHVDPKVINGKPACGEPYFLPEPGQVDAMREQLSRIAEGRTIIGFGWTGGYKKTRMDQRSIQLPNWRPLLDEVPNAVWLSFQYTEDAEQQLNQFFQQFPQYIDKIVHLPHIVKDFNYDTTLAALFCCDYRVFINTTAVHACGAAGLDCYTLTPTKHAWRYGLPGDKQMPFYSTVEQIHQGRHNPTMEQALATVKNRLIGSIKKRQIA